MLIDPKQDLIEVIVLHDGKLECVKAELNHAVWIPAPVQNTLQDWPQDDLRSALAKLPR